MKSIVMVMFGSYCSVWGGGRGVREEERAGMGVGLKIGGWVRYEEERRLR
jgi:hypothetical protein